MGEIRIKYSDVEEALAKLQTAVQSFEPIMPASIGGGNVLEAVEKLNIINHNLQQTLTAYQHLLTRNIEGTRNSVKMMQETDEELVTTMIQR